MKPLQFEMPVVGTCFNLAPETGVDIDRVLREQREALARECAGREFMAKMQRQLAECPGVVGFDPPKCEDGSGRVVIEPAHTLEAFKWLKRRFEVCENLEVAADAGLAIDIRPRLRKRSVPHKRGDGPFTGRKVEQFDLFSPHAWGVMKATK